MENLKIWKEWLRNSNERQVELTLSKSLSYMVKHVDSDESDMRVVILVCGDHLSL